MKSAVCSRSSTASRSPPRVIRGTSAVTALPIGLTRRSRILFVPLAVNMGWVQFVEDDADQLALGAVEVVEDAFQAIVDIEVGWQDRDETVGDLDQLAAGLAGWHRR